MDDLFFLNYRLHWDLPFSAPLSQTPSRPIALFSTARARDPKVSLFAKYQGHRSSDSTHTGTLLWANAEVGGESTSSTDKLPFRFPRIGNNKSTWKNGWKSHFIYKRRTPNAGLEKTPGQNFRILIKRRGALNRENTLWPKRLKNVPYPWDCNYLWSPYKEVLPRVER